jgi:hypothetical protein
VISERLGHASVAFTLSTWGHVIPGMDKDAATTVADLILGVQKGPGTVVPDPSARNAAINGPLSDSPGWEVKGNALLRTGGGEVWRWMMGLEPTTFLLVSVGLVSNR